VTIPFYDIKDDGVNDLLMTGFPSDKDGQVELGNWRSPPFNRWAFSHVSELVPCALVRMKKGAEAKLVEGSVDLSAFALDQDGSVMDLGEWLEATYTDAIVILKGEEVVFESYFGEMDRRQQHILMSVSKSVLGAVVGCLVEQGVLDLGACVTDVIPEIMGSAYDGATLRNLLDMRVGVLFDENYHASGGPIIEYRKAQLWDPLEIGEAPTDLRRFFRLLTETDGPHEDRFHYVSPNTDLLGWVVERLSGRRYADLVSDLIWKPMGAEEDAYITVDRLGAPRCAGGFCATTRDLARFGRLLADGGRVGDTQVLPETWVRDIIEGGDAAAWDRGDFISLFPDGGMHYRSKWYVERGAHPMAFGLGVFGQNVFVEPESGLVIAKFSSQPLPLDPGFTALTHRGIAMIREMVR